MPISIHCFFFSYDSGFFFSTQIYLHKYRFRLVVIRKHELLRGFFGLFCFVCFFLPSTYVHTGNTRNLYLALCDYGSVYHDYVIKWKHFPRHWPFVRGIHRSPMNPPHKSQWRKALMFSLICALNKRLSKQPWGWWFETSSRSLWCHCDAIFQFMVSAVAKDCTLRYRIWNTFDIIVYYSDILHNQIVNASLYTLLALILYQWWYFHRKITFCNIGTIFLY